MIIQTEGLTKVYSSKFKKQSVQALVDLNININQGSIFGLLGPNGAGKTTLVKLLLSIVNPTAGDAKIMGQPVTNYEIKKRIGYLPENHKYPSYMKGEEVLRFFGKLSGMEPRQINSRTAMLLNLVKLEKWGSAKVKTYSKGMMQRLGLAQAMINDPELIFLDEPTDGVDPIGRKEIRDILLEFKNEGKTIFLNSHLLSEVEMITDRVGILNKGRLLREGTVQELTERAEEYKVVIDPGSFSEVPGDELSANNLTVSDNGIIYLRVSGPEELNQKIDYLRSKKIMIREITPVKTSLEEMFISLIQQSDKEKKQ